MHSRKVLSLCKRSTAVLILVVLGLDSVWPIAPQVTLPPLAGAPSQLLPGQSLTLLPDGRWLLLGGRDTTGPVSKAVIENAHSGAVLELGSGLAIPRAWHSATLLPDGRILVFGGIGQDGRVVKVPELFDPSTNISRPFNSSLLPRAHHTATLLTDGKVLLVGGTGLDGNLITRVELWDARSGTVSVVSSELTLGLSDHTARLLPDGTVLFWGAGAGEIRQSSAEIYDPDTQTFRASSFVLRDAPDLDIPFLEASRPDDGATAVKVDSLISLRFSKPLSVETVNLKSVALADDKGAVQAKVVPAENGMLAFVTPGAPLRPGTIYTVTLQGPRDRQNLPLVYKTLTFQTDGGQKQNIASSTGVSSNTSNVQAEAYPPLMAPRGITALSGQVLQLNRRPLPNVLLQIGVLKTYTDATGRFLLQGLPEGHQVLVIDARTANTNVVTYGLYEDGIDIRARQTTVLNYKIWMTALDTAHIVNIPSPTISDTVVTTPLLPGLELHIPPKTVIYDHDGKIATKISITPVPIEQPPFPLPRGVPVPLYFTIQPGGAYLKVEGAGPKGAQLFYPNAGKTLPGTRFTFWNYDPDQKGWYVYGMGTTAPDGGQVIPDPGVSIYEFTGAMVSNPASGPSSGPTPSRCSTTSLGCTGGSDGDPVSLSTGLFVLQNADFVLPDTIPIRFVRTYRQGDTASRDFGVGTTHNYDIFLVGDQNPFTYQDLVLADGARIHYTRISSGTSWTDAIYKHTGSPTIFFGSTITWNPNRAPRGGWDLRFKDGTIWAFPEACCVSRTQQGALLYTQDRYANTLSITRDTTGNVTQITSPNGRWLQFTYDSCSRIQQITDNAGRSRSYSYDSTNCTSGRLQTATDQSGGVTTYAYQGVTPDQMTSITDARQIQFLQNFYDPNGRVYKQQLANGGIYLFNYSTDPNGNVTQTTVTDPNGNIHQVNFSSPAVFQSGFQTGGYPTSETFALGKAEQQTFTYDLGTPLNNPGSLLQTITDPLGRATAYVYDASGNPTSITQLSGTPNAATTRYTYEPTFSRVTSITDPLGNARTFSYNDSLNQIIGTDPLGNQWTILQNSIGEVISLKDPATNTWQFGYSGADLTTTTDALNNATSYVYDGAGRMVSATDPFGQRTIFTYDGLNNLLTVTDPLNEVTQYGYDPNGNVTSVTDPKNTSSPTQFSYNNMDLVQTRTDALGNSDNYGYDLNGNLSCHTDRKAQITVFGFDGLNRRTSAGFGAASCASTTFQNSITYTYDGGNRLRTVVDSLAGTISRNYDGLDDLNYESTPQGTINYNFDSARRRTSMTVTGQTAVQYGYDAGNRLQQIQQGSTTINLTYDSVGRRSSLILPNGITVGYSYDSDSHITGITYQNSATTLGNLQAIYRAATAAEAEQSLAELEAKWKAYPSVSQVWRRNWPRITPFFNYPPDIRRAIYTTNSVESLNRSLRKIIKIRGGFPNEEAALKLLFLALQQAAKKWTMPIHHWREALNHFTILWPDRMPALDRVAS